MQAETFTKHRCYFLCSSILVLFSLLGITACSSSAPEILSTVTITPTPLPPTATIIWFPATETPTPIPTEIKLPTPELRPGIGNIILSDDFTQETHWQTSKTASGNVVFGKGDLTLAVAAEKRGLQSFYYQAIPADVYLEMTANPSLCRGRDTYGLLLRAESDTSYYRFVLACTGEIRLERYRSGELAVLQDWTVSGQVPPGAPLFLQLGVWMKDNEMRFFINDIYQFSVQDPVFKSGQLGVFARTTNQPPLTVGFSNLKIFAIE